MLDGVKGGSTNAAEGISIGIAGSPYGGIIVAFSSWKVGIASYERFWNGSDTCESPSPVYADIS
jgi:hypothetical protein